MQFLLKEYELVESKWRFLQGLRYAVFASITTLQATIAGTYGYFLASVTSPTSIARFKGSLNNTDAYSMSALVEEIKTATVVAYSALVFLPLLAMVIMIATRILEARLQDMYSACSGRGREIELMLGTPHGVFERLHHAPRRRMFKLDHTKALKLVVGFTVFMWFWLLLTGVYVIYSRH